MSHSTPPKKPTNQSWHTHTHTHTYAGTSRAVCRRCMLKSTARFPSCTPQAASRTQSCNIVRLRSVNFFKFASFLHVYTPPVSQGLSRAVLSVYGLKVPLIFVLFKCSHSTHCLYTISMITAERHFRNPLRSVLMRSVLCLLRDNSYSFMSLLRRLERWAQLCVSCVAFRLV